MIGKAPIDIAKNHTVKQLILREELKLAAKEGKRNILKSRFKKGLGKARILGANVGGDALRTVQAQHVRYGGKTRDKNKMLFVGKF